MSTTLQATLTRLEAMRDSGVTETSVDGVTTKFASMLDLEKRIREIRVKLGYAKQRRGTYSVYMGGR